MNARTTFVLLGILLAGFVALVVFAKKDEPVPATGPVFDGFVREDVKELSFALGAEETRLRRTDDGFDVRVGEAWVPADPAKVEEVLSEIASLRVRDRIPGSEVDAGSLQKWGLDPARARVSFTANGETRGIDLGREGLKRDSMYARAEGSDDVLLVGDEVFETIEPLRTAAMRKRKLVEWVVTDVGRVELREAGEVRFSARRTEEDRSLWRGVEPFGGFVDPDVMESSWLGTILRIEVGDFVADEVSADWLPRYGLESPRYSIELVKTRGGEETRRILIGDAVPEKEGQVYFMIEGEPFVYSGDLGRILEQLGRPVADLMDPHVTRLGWKPLRRAEVEWEGSSFAMVRQESGEWILETPAKRTLDSAAVGEWIESLRNLKAGEVRDSPDLSALGLESPRGRIVLRPSPPAGPHDHDDHGDEEEEEPAEEAPEEPVLVLLFGANVGGAGGEGADGVWLLRESDPGTAYRVPAEDALALVRDGFYAFLPRAVFPDAPAGAASEAGVAALVREHGEESVTLERADGKWPPGNAKPAAVNSVISKLLGLYAVRWVGPAEGREADYGLAEPRFRLVVTFTSKEGEEEARRDVGILVGQRTPGGQYARAIRDGTPGEAVFVLSDADLESFSIPLVE